jgi:hypothetical protein
MGRNCIGKGCTGINCMDRGCGDQTGEIGGYKGRGYCINGGEYHTGETGCFT